MKLEKHDLYLLAAVVVLVVAIAMIVLYLTGGPAYDEQSHRAEITKIYPSVHWPEYREAARDVCGLSEHAFQLVAAMAKDDGLQATRAMSISTAYLCPERLKLLEK